MIKRCDEIYLENSENMPNRTNCIPQAIEEFPPDGFSKEQRAHGWILMHVFLGWYIFIALAIVCDDYFVPAVERISNVLNMQYDVAGATLMAVATSSPEFFVNMIGTFITEGDIGIGTIVGSAVFNLLGVSAFCGIFSGVTVKLDWWPLTRDCFVYFVTITSLIVILQDSLIYWYEAAYLCVLYVCYLLLLYKNRRLSKCARESTLLAKIPCFKTIPELVRENSSNGNDNENTLSNLIVFPSEENCFKKISWSIKWPLHVLFFLTIPDCRVSRQANCYCISFLMCCFWIAVLTYLVSWTLTIIGDTLKIPDSVMGITVLAIGTSVPEAISSINVARKGHGSMAICNSVGSNTFDILICLGVPWLIKTSFFSSMPGRQSLSINSAGIQYTTLTLLMSLVMLYLAFSISNFTFGRCVGFMCLVLYASFLIFATLIEMNIFLVVNNPTCIL